MQRRDFFSASICAGWIFADKGHTMGMKRNIKTLGKTYSYLADPELRKREAGDALLVIRDAEISGVQFRDLQWGRLHFINCDFVGGYEIDLDQLSDTTFEDCRFAGIIGWGVSKSVRYLRCQVTGKSVVIDSSGSSDVRFEDCKLIGADSNPNRWGGIGSRGDATFVGCRIKWFSLAGYKKIMLDDCEVETSGTWTDSRANSGDNYASAAVTINQSKMRGKFDMAAADVQSLTIRDTVLEHLDLSGATVKGDVLMERVRGGYINASPKSVGKFTLSNSEVFGRSGSGFSFEIGMDSAEQVLLEKVNFGTDLTLRVGLGAGRPLKPNEWSVVPKNKLALICNCTMPNVDASWLQVQQLRMEGNSIGSLSLSDSRIDHLELTGNTINRVVDLSNSQVKQSKLQSFAKGQIKLDGSNIRT